MNNNNLKSFSIYYNILILIWQAFRIHQTSNYKIPLYVLLNLILASKRLKSTIGLSWYSADL